MVTTRLSPLRAEERPSIHAPNSAENAVEGKKELVEGVVRGKRGQKGPLTAT